MSVFQLKAAGVELGRVALLSHRREQLGTRPSSGRAAALEREIETHQALAQQWLRRAAEDIPELSPDHAPGNDVIAAQHWASDQIRLQLRNRGVRSSWARSGVLPLAPPERLRRIAQAAQGDAVHFVASALAARATAPAAPLIPLANALTQTSASPQPEVMALHLLLRHGRDPSAGMEWVEAFAAHPASGRKARLRTPQDWVWAWACGLCTGANHEAFALHEKTLPRVTSEAHRVLMERIADRERPRRVREVFATMHPSLRFVFARARAACGTPEQVHSLFVIEKDPKLRGALAPGTHYGSTGLEQALETELIDEVRIALVRSAISDRPDVNSKLFAAEGNVEMRSLLLPTLAGLEPVKLWAFFQEETNAKLKLGLAELLAGAGSPAFPFLIQLLNDPSSLVRLAGAIGLLRLEAPEKEPRSSY